MSPHVSSDVIGWSLIRHGVIDEDLNRVKSIRIDLVAGKPAVITIVRYTDINPIRQGTAELLKGAEIHIEQSTEERPDDRDQAS